MMTCTPLSASKDLKVLIKEGISKLRPTELVKPSYEALRFFCPPGNPAHRGYTFWWDSRCPLRSI
jgi:hypothetical protein